MSARGPGDVEPLAYGMTEAARALGVSRSTVCELVRRGEVRSLKVGARRLVRRIDIEDFLRARIEEVAGPR